MDRQSRVMMNGCNSSLHPRYDDGDENATYSGRFRKSLVTETLGKEKGKQNESTARANLKRESVSRHKYLKAQINEDNYGEEDDFEEVNGEK